MAITLQWQSIILSSWVIFKSAQLQVMDEVGVRRIVFSSSATVYGVPEYLPLDEKHRTGWQGNKDKQNNDILFFFHPIGSCTNPYGTTKYAVEKMMMDLAASSDKWSVTLLRWWRWSCYWWWGWWRVWTWSPLLTHCWGGEDDVVVDDDDDGEYGLGRLF